LPSVLGVGLQLRSLWYYAPFEIRKREFIPTFQ
jgi:hypothetical protein